MSQVGRISGPLLFANLERNGIDLTFRNTLNDTRLLYLNVNDGRVGVNTGTTTKELEVAGTTQTVNLISPHATTPGYDITDSTLTAFVGDILLDASEAVVMPALDNGTIKINDNNIYTTISNASVDLTPHGTGITQIFNDLNVFGNISTPGNITLEGNITLGNNIDQDTVDFNSDVNSDIDPDITRTYDLGSRYKRWKELHTKFVNGASVVSTSATVGGLDMTLAQGNIFYVAQNGSDSNSGDVYLSPVASIRRALELADASTGGPVTIYVSPGDYEEETPLVLPPNVSIIGTELRNVNVFPTSYTLSEDVFHLTDSSTISNLTIKNFYYDSNKGYAFRYSPGTTISNRSPYIQNVTVITHGSSTSVDDPLGFDSGDAGRGAYIDGSELDSASIEASMLFHSCTFITPGADAIVMTNGVRVEWLNSFTYYANRGLYAFNNSSGRVTHDGSTINYGAEIRSIGSASVYGNYGAVADGADTLMYLINHNFAYIGAGKNSTNDDGLVIQENEVVEENSGKIHYVTTDQSGNFRIGDSFFVDFDTGSTSVNIDSLTADSFSGMTVRSGLDTTTIHGDYIETGNLRIDGNLIQSLVNEINISSATGEINLQDSTNITGDLDITGNLSFDGNLNVLGNESTDTLDFNVDFDQDFNPNQHMTFNLGSPTKQWLIAYLSALTTPTITIFDNVITTTDSNADLELRANGTGFIRVTDNVNITNAFTVSGTTTVDDLDINGTFTQSGNINQTGSLNVSEDLTVNQNITVNQQVQLEEILIDDNFITTTTSNADLELRANGTGEVLVPNNNVRINNNLNADNIQTFSNIAITAATTFDTAIINDITISENFITTNNTNSNLELRADGNISVASNDVIITNDLTVQGNTDLQNLEITGSLLHTGNRQQIGNYSIAGEFVVGSIELQDNVVQTIESNSDLELRASGTGEILVPNNNVQIDNDLTVSNITDLQNTNITGTLTHNGNVVQTGNINQTGNLSVTGQVTISSVTKFEDIQVSGNLIETTLSNSNLELRANGTGEVLFNDNVNISQNLFASSITTNNITVDQDLVLDEINLTDSIIQINDNYITTSISNADLELRANGTGEILVPSNDVQIDNNLTVSGVTDLQDTSVTGLVRTGNTNQTGNISLIGNLTVSSITLASALDFGNIEIAGNVVQTTESNSDLELRANGSGNVLFNDSLYVLQDMSAGTLNDTTAITVNNSVSLETLELSTDIQFFDNVITTTNSNSNLELRANGTGSVYLEDFEFTQESISTSATPDSTLSNIILDPGSELINIASTGSLILPKGTTASWTPVTGDIRYNITDNLFEARGSVDRITFGGVYSSDRQTSLTAHPTNNIISLTIDQVEVGQVSYSGLEIHGIEVDDISIQGNTIQTTLSNSNLELRTQAASQLIIEENMSLMNNYIYNNSAGALTIANTGRGYIKFEGTAGTVIPYGTSAERPVSPETGEVRWNDDETYVEVWDGSTWIVAAGVAETITPDEFEDLLLEYTLVYG